MSSIGDKLSSGTESLFDTSRDLTMDTLRGTGKVVGKSGDFLGEAVSGTGNLASRAVRGTGNLASRVVRGTGDMTSRALKGTAHLGEKTIDRGADIAENILHGRVKGTVGASEKLVTGTFSDILKDIEGSLEYGLSNPYVSTSIKVLIALYAAFAAPSLPKGLASLFDNSFVRILIAVLIVYIATKDSSMAILLALAFILSLQTANKYKLIDTSRSVNSPGQLSWLPSENRYHEGFVGNNDNIHSLPHELGNLPHHNNHEEEESYPTHEEAYPTHEEAYPTHEEAYPTHEEAYPTHEESYHEQELLPGVHTPTAHYQDGAISTSHHPIHYNQCGQPHHSINNMKHMHVDETPELGSNQVPGANQNSCVQTFNSQHCSQGLNKPRGFDENAHYYSQA